MPKNLHFDIRKKVLNELFRTKGYSLDQLIKKVSDVIREYQKESTGISKKTIQNDIRHLREEVRKMGADIVCIDGLYRYEPQNFNIYNVPLLPYSIDKIKLAAFILQQIPGLYLHEELKEVYEKMEMRTEHEIMEDQSVIQFDTKPNYVGSVYIAELLEAIIGKTVISFDYQPFTKDKPYRVILHPYLLKEYNNRWFIIGLKEETRLNNTTDVRIYGLERIKSKIKPEIKIDFYKHSKFDPKTYFKDVIGVTIPKDAKPEKVILKFKRDRAAYIETNPLHHSQKLIKETKHHKTFFYKLIVNPELKSILLSYGEDVKVI